MYVEAMVGMWRTGEQVGVRSLEFWEAIQEDERRDVGRRQRWRIG